MVQHSFEPGRLDLRIELQNANVPVGLVVGVVYRNCKYTILGSRSSPHGLGEIVSEAARDFLEDLCIFVK
jgi:hypothetical protein